MATETEEIRGIGHSVRRKEDDRFIRGRGNYIDDMQLPGMLHMAILRSPYAHAKINCDRRLGGAGDAGRRRRRHRRADGAAQPRVDADAVRRHAGGARHRQGALPGTRGRRRDRDDPYVAKDALELIEVDYEPARRRRHPAGSRRRRRAADPRREGGPERQPHLPLGVRRQGGHRRGVRRGRHGRVARHVLPAVAPVAARDLRLRRRRRPRDRPGDDLHDLAGAAR